MDFYFLDRGAVLGALGGDYRGFFGGAGGAIDEEMGEVGGLSLDGMDGWISHVWGE